MRILLLIKDCFYIKSISCDETLGSKSGLTLNGIKNGASTGDETLGSKSGLTPQQKLYAIRHVMKHLEVRVV